MYSENTLNSEVHEIIGSTKQECLDKIREKHGNSFEVLSSVPKLRHGFLGFFQREIWVVSYMTKPSVEKTAGNKTSSAYGSYGSYGAATRLSSPAASSPYGSTPYNGGYSKPQQNDVQTFESNRKDILEKAGGNVGNAIQMVQIVKQMEELRKTMSEQMKVVVQSATSGGDHSSVCKIRDILEDNGFSKSYRNTICKRMKSEFSMEELDDFDYVQQKVVEWIAESIPIAKPENNMPTRIIILVGPTGVGKTTTIAKMSASIAVDFKKNKDNYKFAPRIRMITTDTMRVAATEQLKRWAEIINVEVDKAESSDEIKILYERYASNSDYIFVDTSGYSPNDYENIAKMHTILDVKNIHESVYLVVTAGVSVEDFENIIRNFESFNFKSVIITKCDESKTFGRVISVLSERKKDVSWITNGQEVMGTISLADPMWFVKKLVGFKFNEKDVEKRLNLADKKDGGFVI